MRHRIKSSKVGSFTPEKQKVEIEQLENKSSKRILNSAMMMKPWLRWSFMIVLTWLNRTLS